MRNFLFVFILFFLISCHFNQKDDIIQYPKVPYQQFLKEIKSKKKNLGNKTKEHYFFNLIHNKTPSYWIGTKWDFNGTTTIPRKGNIACGYFITNNLHNIGFKINRFKLAQEPSSYLINKLCEKSTIKRFANFDKMIVYLQKQKKEDVFIVGLDFHTGFITKKENKLYFIHSNFINREGVIKEITSKSRALRSSKSFMVGSILQNNTLLNNWINN